MSPAPNDKHDAYKNQLRKNERARELEARALLTSANQLEQARKPGTKLPFYTKVLQRNQRMWMIFQVSLCDPTNPLPRELKALLLNLGRYVDRVSLRAIPKYQPDLLESLININRRIAAGLSVKVKGDQPPATATAAPSAAPPPSGVPTGSVMTTA